LKYFYSNEDGHAVSDAFGGRWVYLVQAVGKILAVPPQILTTNANGDSALPTLAYLDYAWSGDSATLDGILLLAHHQPSIEMKSRIRLGCHHSPLTL